MKNLLTILLLLFATVSIHAQALKETEAQFIKAEIKHKGKVKNNTKVCFETQEEIKLEGVKIPKYTTFYAVSELKNGRVFFNVKRIKVSEAIYKTEGNSKSLEKVNEGIYDVNLAIVDDDYEEGIVCYKNKEFISTYEGKYYKFKVKDFN